jgi:hypothetical protein
LVTAVRDGSGNLKLISWDIRGIRLNAQGAAAGAVSLISAVRADHPQANRMITAVRDGGGNLKVIAWRIAANGQITRLPQAPGAVNQAGAVSRIAAVANRTGDRVLTAVRDGSGNLRVIPWLVSASGSVNRLAGEGSGGAVDDISAAFVGPSGTLFATAVRDGGGNLKIITWRLAPDGRVTRLREASAGAVSEISVVALGSRLVTAVCDGDGNLKLIAWDVNASGNIVRRKDAQAGAARLITAFPLSGNRMVTAVRDGGGNLKVIAWEVPPTPGDIRRVDDESAGAVSWIAGSVCGDPVLTPIGTVEFQTSVRDGSGKLKIIKWRMPVNGDTITRFDVGGGAAGEVSLIATACFLV